MTRTTHEFIHADAGGLRALDDGMAHLIVTSPPYPMIAMWDEQLAANAPGAGDALARGDGDTAFALMHALLDRTWDECARALCEGGIICVNIGDAVRTIGGRFRLFSNHARVITALAERGLTLLPLVLWRKTTNAPNKFMGSGMLPGGAYVTLEHEYIIIARKGDPRRGATGDERARRRESAIFWEERNTWFSDLWSLAGVRQRMPGTAERSRSAAFPLEIPLRLIAMYSWRGDTVLDPFAGTGTTSLAAIALARNSVAADVSEELVAIARGRALAPEILPVLAAVSDDRLAAHRDFVAGRDAPPKHWNDHLGVAVVTGQETELRLPRPVRVEEDGERVVAEHTDEVRAERRQLELGPFDPD
jgi:modification methylase